MEVSIILKWFYSYLLKGSVKRNEASSAAVPSANDEVAKL